MMNNNLVVFTMNNEEYYYDEYADRPSKSEIAQWQKETKEWEKSQLHHQLARTHLKDYEASYFRITKQDIDELVSIIENSNKEEDVQQFLKSHPTILTHYLHGGHGRFCIAKKSLGGMVYPDFLLADLSSLGLTWYVVELENPKAAMFNKNGDPSRFLNHAIKQIRDCRDWLKNNLNEATKLEQDKGSGLFGIEPELECLILIGRRRDLDERVLDARRRMNKEINGEIHTYDWLIEQAKNEFVRVETREFGRKLREELERQGKYHHIDIGDIKE